jgi:diadenosine tetraphosphate (Ap4A) HIT family hydrolase
LTFFGTLFNVQKPDCLFCDFGNPERNSIIVETELAYARWDDFPASKGHAGVVPKRHVESYFDLSDDELLAIYGLSKQVKEIADAKYYPDAYNIGVNDGEAAGRTIHHCHVHLIPRYVGDVENPRGGVRHIIPGKGNY